MASFTTNALLKTLLVAKGMFYQSKQIQNMGEDVSILLKVEIDPFVLNDDLHQYVD